MTIMAAGVHLAIDFAAKVDLGFLVDRQRVHVGPQCHAGTVAVAEPAEYPGLGNRRSILDSEFVEGVPHEGRGFDLLIHHFRAAMKSTPNLDDPVLDGGGVFVGLFGGHRWFLLMPGYRTRVDVTHCIGDSAHRHARRLCRDRAKSSDSVAGDVVGHRQRADNALSLVDQRAGHHARVVTE